MSSSQMNGSRPPLTTRWLLVAGVFLAASVFGFAVMATIRGFQIPSSDFTDTSIAFGIPLIAFFILLHRWCFHSFSPGIRVSISALCSLFLAAVAFLVAFSAAWGILGGGAGP